MTVRCDLYLENPEEHAEHLAECESCRRFEESLHLAPERLSGGAPITSRLPVAPWEGAGHRSWIVVFAVALAVLAATALLFTLTGVSPVHGFSAVLRSLAPSVNLLNAGGSIAELLRQAPMTFHLFVLTAFLIVNILFVLLLRRPPKGYDVTVR
jgi:hypothetical protein